MADSFGLKIGLEGEKEFKKALADINQSFKVLGSEMKLATSQFDKNDKSVEALAARNKVLRKVLDRFFDDDEIAFLKDTIIPTPNAQSRYNTAYGIFPGYSIGVKAEEHPEIEYDQLVTKKMTEDIQRHAGYIANKIKSNGLDMHSFYIYILPFMDAETNKSEIMDHVMKGAVVL